jgi:hypothetical protein
MLTLKLHVSAIILCLLKLLVLHNFKNSTHFSRNSFVKICGRHYLDGNFILFFSTTSAKTFLSFWKELVRNNHKSTLVFTSSASNVCLTFTILKFSRPIFMKVAIQNFTQISPLVVEMIHEKKLRKDGET